MASGPLVMYYDLPHFTIYACIYLPLAGLLYTCAIYFICLSHSHVSYGPHSPLINLFTFTDLQIPAIGCICGTKWAKVVSQSGECLPTARRSGGDRTSSLLPSPTSPLVMSAKQPAHRRKGGSVEVVDSKYAVDLATQQSYSENVFLFVPNLIG